MSSPSSVVHLSSDVVATTLDDGETVLLDLNTRRYYTLNGTASDVWELLEEGNSIEEVVSTLSGKWELEPEEAQGHVHSLISELKEEALIEEQRG